MEQATLDEMTIPNTQSSSVSMNGFRDEDSSSQERPDVLWCLSLKEYGKSERNFYKDTTWKGINNGLPGSDPDEDSDSRAVITYTINAEVYDVTGKEPNSSHNWRERPVDFEFGRDAFLRMRHPPFLTIHSKRLTKLVQSTLGYYPFRIGQGFFAATRYDCFPELMFCFQTLKHYLATYTQSITEKERKDPRFHVDNFGDENLADSLNFGLQELLPQDDMELLHEGSTARDLAVLLRLLSGMYRSSIMPALTSIHLDENPVIAYKDLWMLFRPGAIVYVKQSAFEGPGTSGSLLPSPPPHHRRSRRLPSTQSNADHEYSACVVAEWIYREGSFLPTPDNEKPYSRIELVLWNIHWTETAFQRIACYADIPKYDSLVPIRDLAVIPAKVHDRFDGGQLRRRLQDRGRKYVGILKEPMAPHREYSYKPAANDGEIIIDPVAYQQFGPPKHKVPMDSARPAAIADGDGFRSWFSNLSDVKPSQVESSPFAEDMYLLLPRWTEGFALRTKKWMVLEIDGISEGPPKYSYNQLESELVLVSDADKRSLKTVLPRGQNSISTVSDFVVGKGEGKVFLLYGGPGTGKTLTVECVANDTRRPLLRITAQDLGLEHNVETELRNWFTLAAKWDAILLIDEADLFLEQRREGDLMRNSLSTVFLRSMEYYKGVLFLTTNRPGHLDDSFISRITCPIAYPALSKETKEKIVRRFVRRFEGTGKIQIDPAASEHLIDECADFNGRELRNVLQNAVAAAEMDYREAAGSSASSQKHIRIAVTFLHVRDAVQRHLGFHKYLRTLRGKNEEARAKGKQDYLP